jgi:hypothetical protein
VPAGRRKRTISFAYIREVWYRDIFGCVPNKDEYECSENEYYLTLTKCIEEKSPIETFLAKKGK